MTESVVGLRFVAQGETEARQAVERFNAAQTTALQLTRRMESASSQMESSVARLNRQYSDGARSSQLYGNALREVKRQYAALTGGSIQKASAEVEKFSRALEAQKRTALDDSAQKNYDRLVASLDPAIAAVQRFQQSMITLNTAQERGVISSREYGEVQAKLLQQLNATRVAADNTARQGFNRLAAELDPLTAATQRYEQRLSILAEAEKRGQATVAESARMRQRITQAYNAQRRELSGVANAEREAENATRQATESKTAAQRGYQQLRASIDPAVAAQQRFADAQRRVEAAVRAGVITQQQGMATLSAYRTTLGAATNGMLAADTAAGRVRAQLLATANSVAILDGPLGGIASRFSALGVLIGRTGLIIGGSLVAFAALSFAISKAVKLFSEYEREMARIEGVLRATGHAAGITATEIERMAERIAVTTLASSGEVRRAAGQLLTFRSVGKDAFEDVLRAATDLAALGFGTVESEAVKLAKALEDPRQSLASLSRSGITFTRQQRAMILSMVEAGYHGAALAKILENVNSQVGGTAQREAETFAGKLDTIGQALGLFFREAGEGVAGDDTAFGRVMQALADEAARAIQNANKTLEQERKDYELLMSRVVAEVAAAQAKLQLLFMALDAPASVQNPRQPAVQAIREAQEQLTALLALQAKVQADLAALAGQTITQAATDSENALSRLNAAVGELQIGLSTALVDMAPTAMDVFVTKTLAATRSAGQLGQAVTASREEVEKMARAMFEVERAGRLMSDMRSAIDQTPEMVASLQAQVMFAGMNTNHARVQQELARQNLRVEEQLVALEAQKAGANAETVASLEQASELLRAQLMLLAGSRQAALDLALQLDRIDSASRRNEAAATAAQRIAAMEAEIAMVSAIRDSGEQSEAVEQLRLKVAQAQTEEFIAQLDLLTAAEKTRLRELTTQNAQVRTDSQRKNDLDAHNKALQTTADEQTRILELLAMGNSMESARSMLQQEQLVNEQARLEALAQAVLATEGISDATRAAAQETLRLLAEARALAPAFDAAAFAASRITIEAQRAAAATAALRSELMSLGSGVQVAGMDAEIKALERGASRAEAAVARVRAQGAADPRMKEVLARGDAIETAQFGELIEKAAQQEAARVRAQERLSELTKTGRAGGGGGSAQELVTLQGIVAEMERQIAKEIELLGLQGRARRERELYFEIVEQLRQQGVAFTDESVMQAAARLAAREEEREQLQRMEDDMQRLAQTMESALTDGFMSIVDGTKTASQAFKDMARQIIAELFRVLVVQQLVGQFKAGGGGILGALAGRLGSKSADGNVFTGGNVVPFARGGVVSRPSLFPMSGGQTGLMGEAGPEAIMPLKRGRDGKLGVAAEGGSSVVQHFHFNLAANGDESVRKIVAQAAPQIVEAAKAGVLDARRRGGQFRAAFGGGG